MDNDRQFKTYSEELKQKYGRVTFARLLLAWRESENLTQSQFAKKIGISAANLCDLEQGNRIPSPDQARRIAKQLGLPEMGLVAKAIEDALYRNGMKYSVELKNAASPVTLD